MPKHLVHSDHEYVRYDISIKGGDARSTISLDAIRDPYR